MVFPELTANYSDYSDVPFPAVILTIISRVKKDKYKTDQSGEEMGCVQEKAKEVKMCQDSAFYQLVLYRIIEWFALEGALKII